MVISLAADTHEEHIKCNVIHMRTTQAWLQMVNKMATNAPNIFILKLAFIQTVVNGNHQS